MTPRIGPGDEAELAAAVAEAAAKRTPLAIEGGGTRSGLGRVMQTAATLSTAGLAGITLYEPSELVLSARAGTPLGEVDDLLSENNQSLAFEPPDYRCLYASSGTPTIGALAAANLSGPRRIQAGAARDGLIGVRAVNGEGRVIKSGGRVMKNVTGYDLVKFLAGSHGTLAVLTEVTFKLQPAAETATTLALSGLADRRAVAALSAALGSPFAVTGAAHVPDDGHGAARTLIRLEGFVASVAERAAKLSDALAAFGVAEMLTGESSASAWRDVRDLAALRAPDDDCVWRVSVRPGDGPTVAETVRDATSCRVLYDWGGGLVWIAAACGDDGCAGVVRKAVKAVGGHATLVRAPDAIRAVTDVFEPQSTPILALTRSLKRSFDPAGILNPGRMIAGI